MSRAIVIGGGIGGLATAALLAREGYDTILLEKNHETGGRAGTLSEDGFRFDTGPSWFLMPAIFDRYYRLLGTSLSEQLNLVELTPSYRVYDGGGGITDVRSGREHAISLFEHLEPGSGGALAQHLDSAGKWLRLAEEGFLYNTFERPLTLAKGELLTALPQALTLAGTSLDTMVRRTFRNEVARQILTYHGLFLGTDPRQLPALYHLMSALDLGDAVRYPVGGFGTVTASLQRLAEQNGARLITGARVTKIVTRTGASTPTRRSKGSNMNLRAVAVAFTHSHGEQAELEADIVVSAADLHHTELNLLEPAARSYTQRWWSRRTSGPGAVIGMLGVEGCIPELLHHSLFFKSDWNDNFDAIFGATARDLPSPFSFYVSRTSATDAGAAPPGYENLFVLVPAPADPALGSGGRNGAGNPAVETVLDAAIDQLSAWSGVPRLKQRIVFRRSLGPGDFHSGYNSWRGGMLGPAHTIRQSAMFRPGNRSRKVSNLYYAGATVTPGVGVPMCLISAELVLKHLRGDTSPGPLAGME